MTRTCRAPASSTRSRRCPSSLSSTRRSRCSSTRWTSTPRRSSPSPPAPSWWKPSYARPNEDRIPPSRDREETMSDLEQKLREIVARIAEIPKDFPAEAHMRDDLNVDSFRGVEIVFEIERQFDISVPGSRYGEVETFKDMLALVTSLKG